MQREYIYTNMRGVYQEKREYTKNINKYTEWKLGCIVARDCIL